MVSVAENSSKIKVQTTSERHVYIHSFEIAVARQSRVVKSRSQGERILFSSEDEVRGYIFDTSFFSLSQG